MNLNDLLPWVAAWFVMSMFFGLRTENMDIHHEGLPYWKWVMVVFVMPIIVILSPIYLCLRFVVSLGESIYEMKVKR